MRVKYIFGFTFVLLVVIGLLVGCATSQTTSTTTTNSTTTTTTTTSTTTTISGLLAHYAFNEGSGSVATDSSSNSLSGTIYGATWATGRSSNALSFDGTNDYVQIPGSGEVAPTQVSTSSAGSIAIWFKFEQEAGVNAIFLPLLYLGSSPEATGAKDGCIIEIGHKGVYTDNTELFFTLTLPGSSEPIQCFDTGYNLTTEAWYHFVAIVSSTGNTGYLNGTEMSTREYNFGDSSFNYFLDSMNSGLLSIGYGRSAIDALLYYFKGTIDDVQIYNRALTSAEVTQLYQQ